MFYTIEKSLKVYFTMFVLLYQLHKSNKFTNKQTQINQNSDKKYYNGLSGWCTTTVIH